MYIAARTVFRTIALRACHVGTTACYIRPWPGRKCTRFTGVINIPRVRTRCISCQLSRTAITADRGCIPRFMTLTITGPASTRPPCPATGRDRTIGTEVYITARTVFRTIALRACHAGTTARYICTRHSLEWCRFFDLSIPIRIVYCVLAHLTLGTIVAVGINILIAIGITGPASTRPPRPATGRDRAKAACVNCLGGAWFISCTRTRFPYGINSAMCICIISRQSKIARAGSFVCRPTNQYISRTVKRICLAIIQITRFTRRTRC